MKRTSILLTFSAALAVLTFNSNSSGPANNSNGNRTGGPGSAGTCTSCHTATGGTTGSVSLRKKTDNTPASGQYIPGEIYIVTVSGNHASLPKFGFQLMALKDNDNTQAGTFSNLGTDQHSKTISGIVLVEHHHTLSKTGTEFKTEFEWTAPATGTGNVKFYGALNAVDGTGTTGSDAGSPAFNLTLAEAPNGINDVALQPVLSVYPNPVKEILHVSVQDNGEYTLKVYSLDGRTIFNKQVQAASNKVSVPADFTTGTYILELTNSRGSLATPFIKE